MTNVNIDTIYIPLLLQGNALFAGKIPTKGDAIELVCINSFLQSNGETEIHLAFRVVGETQMVVNTPKTIEA